MLRLARPPLRERVRTTAQGILLSQHRQGLSAFASIRLLLLFVV
jgi:hypothetical protein